MRVVRTGQAKRDTEGRDNGNCDRPLSLLRAVRRRSWRVTHGCFVKKSCVSIVEVGNRRQKR